MSQKANELYDNLFSAWNSEEEKLESAAKLLCELAENIEPHRFEIDLDRDLVMKFDAVFLWIRSKNRLLSNEIREQITRLLAESKAEPTLSHLASLGLDEQRGLSRKYARPNSLISWIIRSFETTNIPSNLLLTPDSLRECKIALRRLSTTLEYAASELREIGENDDAFVRDHFNPTQIDRTRVTDLLDQLQAQIESLPATSAKYELKAKVLEVKIELARPKPRWKSILGTMLLVLAVAADLKSVAPSESLDAALAVVDAVIQSIVTGGQVNGGPRLPEAKIVHWAIEPKRIEYKKEQDEDAG